MKAIVYRWPDGGVSIVHPSQSYLATLMARGMTEAEALAAVQAKVVPSDATGVEIVEDSDIPGFDSVTGTLHHHEFRDALEKPSVGPPIVNMAKARKIHVRVIEDVKGREVSRLASEEARARSAGRTVDADKAASDRAVVEAIDLGAVNNQITNAATPEELSAVWPAELRRRP
ncbi:MAG: hypothetical protein ACE5HV_00205 [Acidobacteriota bacterium]